MSNFGVTYLLKTDIGRNRLSIEDNIGEDIHIHFGGMRLSINYEDFALFSSECIDLIADATDIEKHNLQKLDPIFLFDLCRKGELPTMRFYNEEYVPVGNLFCPCYDKFGFWWYRNIKHSHFLDVMSGKTNKSPFDEKQISFFGENNVTRCQKMMELCRADKNICDKYPLFVTRNNIIRDGQHRAAALFYLYGPKHLVKIQRMETNSASLFFDPAHPNKGRMKKKIKHIFLRGYLTAKKILMFPFFRNKNNHKSFRDNKKKYEKIISAPFNISDFNAIKTDVRMAEMMYFVDEGFALNKFPTLIRKNPVGMDAAVELIKANGFYVMDGHKLDGHTFIYGLKPDFLVFNKKNEPVAYLQDKISANAMSVRSFMPLSPEIQKYLENFAEVPVEILFSLKLLKCMFDHETNGFTEHDKRYFINNNQILKSKFFSKNGLFKTIFFDYADRLVYLLNKGATDATVFDSIISDYRRYGFK